MRKAFLIIVILLANKVSAQHIELNFQASGGLFHYSGGTTSGESAINLASAASSTQGTGNNPFGSNNAFSYGLCTQVTIVKKSGFIFGLNAGYVVLRSSLNINGLYFNYYNYEPGTAVYDINRLNQIDASGQTILTNNQILMNPFVGYRIKVNKIKVDFMPGLDIGFNLKSTETDQATDISGKSYFTSTSVNNIPTDIRIKVGTLISYDRYGLIASFSQGLTNLNRNGPNNSGNSEFLQFGISYKLL